MEEGYRSYALVTMIIAGLFILVNISLLKKRGPSAFVMAAALGAFILFQYTFYNDQAIALRWYALGLLICLLIAHFIVGIRTRPKVKP